MNLQEHNIQGQEGLIVKATENELLPVRNRPPTHRAALTTRRVDHTYCDYSQYSVDNLPLSKGSCTNTFPTKLHLILANPEYSHVSLIGHGICVQSPMYPSVQHVFF